MAVLWIFGAALLLAGFSYHYWLAGEKGIKVKEQLDRPPFLRIMYLSFIFIGLGLAGSSVRWWETAVWVMFILFNIFNIFQLKNE